MPTNAAAQAAIPIPGGLITLGLAAAGIDAAIGYLEGLLARMLDQTPAWRAVGDHLRGQTVARWGQGWPPRKVDPGWPILHHTGDLMGQVTGAAAVRVTARGLRYVVAGGKPVWHQYGTRRGLPARPMVRLGAGDASFAANAVRAFVLGGATGGAGPWRTA